MLAPWVMDEVKTADLNDKRLKKRLAEVLVPVGGTADGEHSRRVWRTCRDGRRLSAYCEREDELWQFLQPHVDATRRRMAAQPSSAGAGHVRNRRDAAGATSDGCGSVGRELVAEHCCT